ncbi:MAG: entericidin [Prevotellaceae bacterium]|nr:entericidin [Prevotellaceae bacterium]
MKKLVFMFVALAAISFASCGNKAQTTTTNDSDSVQVDSLQQDSTHADSAATDTVKADSVKA